MCTAALLFHIMTSAQSLQSLADLLSWDAEDVERCLRIYSLCGVILHSPGYHLTLSDCPLDISAFIDCFRLIVPAPTSSCSSDEAVLTVDDAGDSDASPAQMDIQPDAASKQLTRLGRWRWCYPIHFTPLCVCVWAIIQSCLSSNSNGMMGSSYFARNPLQIRYQ